MLVSAIMLYGYIKVFHGKADNADNTGNTGNATRASHTDDPQPTHILYQLGFEDNDPFPSFLSKQVASQYGIEIVESPVYRGRKAARFELRCGDAENNNGTRAEISFPQPDDQSNLERWYAFALLFPKEDYEPDNTDDVITQWHQGGKVSPAISLRTKDDKLYLRIKPDVKSKDKITLGDVERGDWHFYIFHIKHSSGPDGLIEVWRDGKLMGTYNGSNMYDLDNKDFHAPAWKLGIYKSNWNKGKVTNTTKRVLYVDEIKCGDERATFADMMPKK
ncbi:polysaccharide lyase [Niastella yeongjuensis]|nr:polysaccharide lyase [Niastella yeongjuensis]